MGHSLPLTLQLEWRWEGPWRPGVDMEFEPGAGNPMRLFPQGGMRGKGRKRQRTTKMESRTPRMELGNLLEQHPECWRKETKGSAQQNLEHGKALETVWSLECQKCLGGGI